MAPSTVSHYKILKKIGEGGMGVVFKAEDTMLNRTVALKFLPSHLAATEEDRSRFLQEARAAATLNHPNVCIIHGIEREGDQQFIVMEFVDGINLRQKIVRRIGGAALPLGDALSYAIQIAEALREAHRLGIIHRDVKSENIMVNVRDQVKVMDFGLAKLKGSLRLTRGPRMIGTPGYMAPEQIQGGTIDPRADIFSFGVVLYEMLTGRLPFKGDHEAALVYSVLSGEPLPIEDVRPGLPPALVALVLRALRKDPGERYQSAAEMVVELRRIAKTTVPASGISLPETSPLPSAVRVRRFARLLGSIFRPTTALHKVLLVAVVAIAAALVWVLAPARSVLLKQSDFLVLADFDNRTGDSVLNHSLTEALRVKLRESTQFNVLSADRVSTARELLRVPDTAPLDDRTAIAVARREGARAVVAGNATRLGSTYVLTAAIIDASTGTTVDLPHEQVSKIEDVLSSMDRLSGRVRRGLGESLAQIAKANSPLPEATTSSLEALELYSRADALAEDRKYEDAALLNQKAVTIDSEFVMAISELSYDYRKLGNDSLAALYHSRILPLIHRVTERERLEILATYYGPSFELNFQKAREQIQQLTVRYPNDADPFVSLGHMSMFAGETKAALDANARAVTLYPECEKVCSYSSGYALALAGKPAEAMIFFRKAQSLQPGYAGVDMSVALTLWMTGDLDSSEALLRRTMEAAEPHQRSQVRVVLGSLAYFRGHVTSSRDICLEGVRECRAGGRPGDEAYFHFLLGEIAAVEGKTGEFRAQMAVASRLSISPYHDLALVGMSYGREGMRREAESILARLENVQSHDPWFLRYLPAYLDLIRGAIMMSERQYANARKHFEAVAKVQAGDPYYQIAQLGIANCAARTSDSTTPHLFEFISSSRGEIMLAYLSSVRRTGPWTRWLWPDTELEIGEFFASRHQSPKAMAHINAALRYWNNAEASDRRAARARALILQLSRGG